MAAMIDWPIDDGWGSGGGSGGGVGGSGGSSGGGGVGGTYEGRNIEFGRLLLAVSEGKIKGPVGLAAGDALKHIFLNDTAIQNADDSFNIKGVSIASVIGSNSQTALPGFPDVESETSVNVNVTFASPSTQTISSTGLSAVRVRVSIPTLKRLDPTTGTESKATVQIKIERQRTGYNAGAYEEVDLDQDGIIYGKYGSKFTKAYRIELPDVGTGAWSIRMTRLTADHSDTAPDYIQDDTYWESYTEITDARLSYPNTSLLAVLVDAKQFSNLPNVSVDMDLKIVNVPANYTPATQDPDTGVWTAAVYATSGIGTTGGIWDGTFKEEFTRNPVWEFLDLATNTRYGGGTYLEASGIDVFGLYAISKICDEMVSDGKGGTEPRYFCDIHIQNQQEAIKVLDNFVSAFRGMMYWAAGKVVAVQDADEEPVALFTAANVKDGKFIYQGSGRKARHTAAMITWNDPAAGYRQATEYVENAAGIARYGLNIAKVAGFGISSQGLAQRFGLWVVLSDLMLPETVSFTTGMASAPPGRVIQVMDPHRAGLSRFGGRVGTGSTTTSIVLDAAVTLGGGTYYLKCVLDDGTVEKKTITSAAGSHSTLTVSTAFSSVPNSVWVVQEGAVAHLYRVLSVKESGPTEFEVTGVYHDPAKYALVDAGAAVVDTGGPAALAFGPVTSLSVTEALRKQSDKIIVVLSANWLSPVTPSGSPTPTGFLAEASNDGGPWIPMAISGNTSELPDVATGAWRVRVFALYANGRKSVETIVSHTVLGKTTPPADVTNFVATPKGDILQETWDPVADLDFDHYIIKVPGAGATDAIKWTAGTAVEGCDNLSVTTVSFIRPASGSYDHWIKAVDTSGNESTNPTKITFAVNPLDNYVTPTEKRAWKAEYSTLWAAKTDLDARADALAVSRVAYDNSLSALDTYLGTLTGAQGWTGGATDDWTSYTSEYYLGDATPATTGLALYNAFKTVWDAQSALVAAILAANVSTPTDAFRPALRWDFGDGSDQGFTLTNITSADSPSPMAKVSRRLTATSTDPQLISPTFSLVGKDARVLVVRLNLVSGTWAGEAYFKGTSPSVGSFTTSNYKVISSPVVGEWIDLVWDLASLTAGGTNAIANTELTQFRLDFCSSNGAVVDVDWIGIGTYGAGSKVDFDNALYQLVLDALANGNVVQLGSTVISNGNNLIPNPKSELTSSQLAAGSYGLVALDSTGLGYNSSTGCRKVLAGATSQITARTECKANEVYYVSAQSKVSGAATAALVVETFTIAGVSQGEVTLASTASTTSTSYGLIYAQATMPANAASFVVKIRCTSGTHGLFDELGCLRCADAALLVNGSVTALIVAAGAIQTHHISVGANYKFTATSGGSPLLMNNDGTFSANTVNGAVENSVDAASYMDALTVYPATRQKVYEAHFTSAAGQDRGFLINMSSPFSAVSTGLRILHSGSAITVKPVSGTRTYGTTITPTTTPNAVPAAGVGKLTAIWAADSGTACTRRLVIKCDGVEVQTYSDAAIAAVDAAQDGQQSGYAGIILGAHGTRPGDVKIWGIALGIGVVTLGDNTVRAENLEADFAIINTIRSNNYDGVAATTQATAGFKVSGTSWSARGADGANHTVQADFTAGMMIAGYMAAVVVNNAVGNSVSWSAAGTQTWTAPEGVTEVEFTLQAAGAPGAGSYGHGGGAGQYKRAFYTVVPGTVYTFTLGAPGSNSTITGSGFTTVTCVCGNSNGNGSGGAVVGATDTDGEGFAVVAEMPEGGWDRDGAAGGGESSGVGVVSGNGGACGAKAGGAGHTYLTGKPTGGGGGASAMAVGGDGNIAVAGAAGAAGTYGSGGGGGFTGGAGGPPFGRVRY